MIWLFVAFTVIPAVELFLLLEMGSIVGPLPTFLFVLLTGVLGAWLAKREGTAVWRQLTEDLRGGLPPGDRLMEAAMVVAGGVLLVAPGVMTDLTGILFLIPFTRRFLAPYLARFLARRFGGVVELGPGRVTEEPPGDGVRFRQPRPAAPEPARKGTPFSSPFDD